MTHGKKTCRILKEIRRQIAEANGIEYATSECRFKGDCTGTCPRCEAELRELEQQLRARSLAGKMVRLAGISAGALALLSPTATAAEPARETIPSVKVNGTVFSCDTLPDGTILKRPEMTSLVYNLNRDASAITDIDGRFEIEACAGDSLLIEGLGFLSQEIIVDKENLHPEIILPDGPMVLGEILIKDENYYKQVKLEIVDADGKPISEDERDVTFEYLCKDDGEEAFEECYLSFDEQEGCYFFTWGREFFYGPNLMPMKEITLRVSVEGYERPQVLNLSYDEGNRSETLRFSK